MLGELLLLTRSINTKNTYLKGLKYFSKVMEFDNLDKLVEDIKKGLVDPNQLYKDFLIKMASRNLAPKTVATWAFSLKKFFEANGIEIKEKIKLRQYAIHEDYLPSKDDLKEILLRANLRTKAIILFLLSSGLRASELLELRLKDVDLNTNPPKVKVKSLISKHRKGRITFITNEAKKYLQLYLEERKKRGEKLTEESYIFATKSGKKMSYQNLQFILSKAFKNFSKKVGKRYNLHPHVLRKFFKTQLISAGLPGPIVDRLAGHARYLATEYELYTESQLKKWYKKGEEALTIFS